MASIQKKGIIYCRLSRVGDNRVMSLDSQEFSIKNFMEINNIPLYKVSKDIGSAFKTSQQDLKNLLNSCKDKIIIVYEASRLTRNLNNFKEIYNICKKNKHNIALVNINMIFRHGNLNDYNILYDLICHAEKESRDMGQRISRSFEYKKSLEPDWGKKRDVNGCIVDNPFENKITKLIFLLHKKDSSISEIRNLIVEVGKTEGKDFFEIVEYERYGSTVDIKDDKMPYPMSLKNIEETLKIYEVKKRNAFWTSKNIKLLLDSKPIINNRITIDNLSENLINTSITNIPPPTSVRTHKPEWVIIYYDPEIGLPPNIVLPEGFELPSFKTMLYVPKQ